MARTAEVVDITPGVKSKAFEISKLKGEELSTPIKGTAEWTVPTVDEIVNQLSTEDGQKALITEIATARRDSAMAAARSKVLSENEPVESKRAKAVAKLVQLGLSLESATENALRMFPNAATE